MKKILIVIYMCVFSFLFYKTSIIYAFSDLNINKIFNVDVSDNYIVYEYTIDSDANKHKIAIYELNTHKNFELLSNNNEELNDNAYFPSISKDGKYIVYTSRSDNITSDNIAMCIDLQDGNQKKCSNIYLYDLELKQSLLIKNKNSNFNGDNYVAKISGDGTSIAFESASNNLVYNKYDCSNINMISSCINILKYDILTGNVSLISTARDGYGGNSNSVSPSISYDGRMVSYQSNATNLINNFNYDKSCYNYITNNSDVCSNVYLVDTINLSTKIISVYDNQLFDADSGNSFISNDGKYVYFESYARNLGSNGKNQIYLYDTIQNKMLSVTNNKGIFYNRDCYIVDVSFNGKYIIYKTKSNNVANYSKGEIYVYSNDGFNSPINIEDGYHIDFLSFKDDNYVAFDSNYRINVHKIDDVPPCIKSGQVIYVLHNEILSLKDKIDVCDNLTTKDKINIYIENIEVLQNVGEHTIFIKSTDAFNNVSSSTINVIVLLSDTEGPNFTDIGEIKILKGSSTLNLSQYINAVDKVDGDVRIFIIDDGNLNLDRTGNYVIKLMAKDKSNNITYKDISVKVYENYNFRYFYEIILIIGVLALIIFSIIKVK